MTYTLDWTERALDHLAGYLADDPAGVRVLVAELDELTERPFPPYASKIGPQYRARIGRYRVVYEVDETTETITVTHIGRTT